MRILVDIGGTHVRFGILDPDDPNPRPTQIKKYRADSFHTFEEAFFVYCKEFKITEPSKMALATAGYPDRHAGQKVWKFVNQNQWVINPAEFDKSQIDVDLVLNDFEAATWGLIDLPGDMFETLHDGLPKAVEGMNKCLLGPGTGLGLGYLIQLEDGGYHVQRTHGAQILAASLTDEHEEVMKAMMRLKAGSGITVYENLASGPGLFMLYRAQCFIAGEKEIFADTRDMLENLDDPQAAEALRLFHEYLGLFAHGVIVSGHAYGGLYLTGGVLDRLIEKDLFDFAHFSRFLNLNAVPSVKRDISHMPIHYVTNRYLSMRGLQLALQSKGLP